MRLSVVEVLNWGTFDKRAWQLELGGENALLTGDIGSGKSTLVDAITSLLVPSHRIAYNKAAGAELRERDLRSYVLGHYKSERGDAGLSAKPVALRSADKTFSVILGQFRNEGFNEHVTLAQVFWFKETHGQPARFFVVADRSLSIVEHFSNFGRDINALRKRLRRMSRVEIYDSFPPYGAAFRRRFRIESEQALELFLQTVSMKSVGDLTDFVRSHMLEPFPVEERINHMIAHFDDLTRAHEAVLKARAQIERLIPLVADCDSHTALSSDVERLKACRDALCAYFATYKCELLDKRIAGLDAELGRLDERIAKLRTRQNDRERDRDALRHAILENGGDRIASLEREIASRRMTARERQQRAEAYNGLATELGYSAPRGADDFADNQAQVREELAKSQAIEAEVQNRTVEREIAFRELRREHTALTSEIRSLKSRRSNIPSQMLDIRDRLCEALDLESTSLPFAGELIEVRKDEAAWEGAAERLLHNFALALLVPDERYAAVAEWVNATQLAARLVYYRVHEKFGPVRQRRSRHALSEKLQLKDDSPFYQWLQREIDDRFDHVCATSLDEFRREDKAITRNGQIKTGGKRHEKDDRSRIDDRTRYVLGWSNEAKIAAFEKQSTSLEARIQAIAAEIAKLAAERKTLAYRVGLLQQLSACRSFSDIDWQSIVVEIDRLENERRQLAQGSDVLRTLAARLEQVESALTETREKLEAATREEAQRDEKRQEARRQRSTAAANVAALPEDVRGSLFPILDAMCAKVPGESRLTVESCDNRERDMRDWLDRELEGLRQRIARLRDKIVGAMRDYANRYPEETREVDTSVESAGEYRQMLDLLQTDGLPRFEARFKVLLNENTIREVAGFQSQLRRETREIRERIETINESLVQIDYNPGRYIVLELQSTVDPEIREFQQDLRTCTEGTLSGSEDSAYSEAKFLEVKRIIERFRGRDGLTEMDKRWTRKVTDVRNWFVFSASERWRSDDSEHEHYTDSGGKSGGQKEKLAYTILAASLAYQFGLEWHAERSRAFHFVVIDEAFGRGSDESARYGLELFKKMGLQLLIATPLQKIHIIEPYVAAVGFVHNEEGRRSLLRNLTIEEYRAERLRRAG
jgi:uncharacterized protein YPO0396